MISGLRRILLLLVVLASALAAMHLYDARTRLSIQKEQIEVAWVKVEQDLDRRADVLNRLVHLMRLPHATRRSQKIDKQVTRLADRLAEAKEATTRPLRIESSRNIEEALLPLRARLDSRLRDHPDDELQRLLEEILAIENRIHRDRTEYNETVQRYNVELVLFPSNIAARVFGIERHDFYLPTDLLSTAQGRSTAAFP